MSIVTNLIALLLLTQLAVVRSEVVLVNYTHNGDALVGFMAVPSSTVGSGPFPAVVIIPDRDGLNDYEKRRAELIAEEFGYIGFAADIFGDVQDLEQRGPELAAMYRNDTSLFASRITAAVDAVRKLDQVDPSNIAIIGYCFGGTGVLIYAMLGINGDGVKAIVSFHGGLTQVPGANPNVTTVTPKVLVLSGGDDDATSDIMELELEMDAAGANWEITRYSNIEHAFTVFNGTRYNEWADMRSWRSAREFLAEAFGDLVFESSPPVAVNVETVDYVDTDGTQLRGYLARPTEPLDGSRPTIVIIPDWDGNNEYEQQRATELADLGYIAFAADIYGADLQFVESFEQRANLTTSYRNNTALFVQRMERALAEVKTVEGVDTSNIAVIGYCFGGTGIIELAFSGNSDVKLVVSFHGGLTDLPDPSVTITPYVLVLSGGADDAHGNQTELEAALNQANATWEITRYSGVGHGFTSWKSPAYSLKADYRSWQSMLTSMAELMPTTTATTNATNLTLTDAPSVMPVAARPATNTSSSPMATPTPVNSSAPALGVPPTGSPLAPVVPSKAPSPKIATATSAAGIACATRVLQVTIVVAAHFVPCSFSFW